MAMVPVLDFASVQCVYTVDGNSKKTISKDLISISLQTDIGRFIEIQFGDQVQRVQYQILLENDVKVTEAVNVLQNLKINDVESSSEFSAVKPAFARISQGAHSVRCELIKGTK